MPTSREWEKIANGDIKARNRIWVKYQGLITHMARGLSVSLPKYVETEDLESSGQLGLKDAIEKFDPERGFKFETYASFRIRGAMIDGLRRTDWSPRSVRSRDRKVDMATSELLQSLGRTPTPDEVAEFAGVSVKDVYRAETDSRLGSLDVEILEDGSDSLESILTNDSGDLSDQVLTTFRAEELADAIAGLQPRERVTLVLHYLHNRTLAEIGSEFGVTESRCCQILSKSLRDIRATMLGGSSEK